MVAPEGGKIGKRIGRSVYLHRSALPLLPEERRAVVSAAAEAAGWDSWNVVRLENGGRVSLLEYQGFEDVPFPSLIESRLVDVDGRVARRDFRPSPNPPLLHRKELLLPPNHPRIPEYAALTAELEAEGLFEEPNRIGTRQAWEARLKEAGVVLVGHSIVKSSPRPGPQVARHKTAIARHRLSVPMQALVRAGLLSEGRTVFDYGCGRGDDIAALGSAGIDAKGWDPHWRPAAELAEAEIVNLGFVLNVIERPEERIETARMAFALASVCMCVGVMLVGKGSIAGLRRLGDGYLSNRGTFQKYFTQAEIKGLLERALGLEAIAAAPGVFFVFKDKIEEQRFLAGRLRQARDASALIRRAVPPPRPRVSKAERVPRQPRLTVAERNRETLAALWAVALDLGRLPVEEELPADLVSAVADGVGSIKRAFVMAERLFGGDGGLEAARDVRVSDLIVYFALNLFNKRQAYGELPPELQRDVRAFFGSLKDAEEAGRELLFSLGRPETVAAACRDAASQGLGYLGDRSLLFDARLANRLPALLRAYIGCAEKLYGSVDRADAIKVHIGSGKLTLLRYKGYADMPLPRLIERVKINLKEQDWDEFDYGNEDRVLALKSLLMSPDLPDYQAQAGFDAGLKAVLPELMGPIDIPREVIDRALGRGTT
ncbi:DNA phosphorothioation-associated putative methyltransferase [Azospirillum argentinense]|nr:DNA phosphorothioation-associated putative methyltransferase [Azospirillum argentinense]